MQIQSDNTETWSEFQAKRGASQGMQLPRRPNQMRTNPLSTTTTTTTTIQVE